MRETPIGGVRAPGILIHSQWTRYIRGEHFSSGVALGVRLDHPVLGVLFFVTAHLDSTVSRSAYRSSLANLREVISRCPYEATLVCGVDANTNLARLDQEENFIGPSLGFLTHRAWEGEIIIPGHM